MPLSKTALGQEIAAAIGGVQETVDPSKLTAFANALAQAIIDHITDNAIVTMNGGGIDSNGDTLVDPTGKIS